MKRDPLWATMRAIGIGIPAALITIGTVESVIAAIFGA